MTTHIVSDSFGLTAFKENAKASDMVAIDIETTVEENPWMNKPVLVSAAMNFGTRHSWVFRRDEWLHKAVDALYGHKILMHNGLFDRLMLKAMFDLDVALHHDTMAMQYLLDPDEPKGLEDLSLRYLGLGPYKNVDYRHILEEPFEKVAEMNAEDARRTYQLYRPLADELNKDKKLSRVYQWIIMPAVNQLIETTITGVQLNTDELQSVTDTTQEKIDDLLIRIQGPVADLQEWPRPTWWRKKHGEYDGTYFNPNSTQQLSCVLYEHWGLKPIEFTETGNPSNSADVLLRLETHSVKGKKQEWLRDLREYKTLTKLLSYYTAWPTLTDEYGRLHPKYKPLHVVTGRLSSESPNIQQVPRAKDVRSLFVAPEGYTWLKADYSQVELRIAAWLSGERQMLQAYREGQDLHRLTAMLVLDDNSDEARQVGKTLNFGLLYGAGPATLQRVARSDYGVELSDRDARTYRELFFDSYPGLRQWHQDMERQIETTGESRSPLGRVRYLPKAKIPRNVEDMQAQKFAAIREGINHPVQSFASDLLLMSLVRLAPKLEELGTKSCAEVHDEIDYYCPTENVSQVTDIIKETMEDTSWLARFGIKLGVPLVVDVEQGPNWGELT